MEFGAVLSCIFTSFLIMRVASLTTKQSDELTKNKEFITDRSIKSAWLDVKEDYCEIRDLSSRRDLITYTDYHLRRFEVDSYVQSWGGKTGISKPKYHQFLDLYEEAKLGYSVHDFFREKLDEWMNTEIYSLNSLNDMVGYQWEIDREVYSCFMQELTLVMKWQLYILKSSFTQRNMKIKYLLRFISEMRI